MDTTTFGQLIRDTRKNQRIRQEDLAMMSGTSRKFIIDLEGGKSTCELGKALNVANALGIELYARTTASNPDSSHS